MKKIGLYSLVLIVGIIFMTTQLSGGESLLAENLTSERLPSIENSIELDVARGYEFGDIKSLDSDYIGEDLAILVDSSLVHGCIRSAEVTTPTGDTYSVDLSSVDQGFVISDLQKGTYKITCAMGMYQGSFEVK